MTIVTGASETYGEPRERISTGVWIVLALVVLAGLAVRCIGVGEPVAGYHAFNEGFYLDLAKQYAAKGLLSPLTAPIDTFNPPVYPFLLALVTSVAGTAVATARILSVLAALATSVSLFFLGRRLYGEVAGLVAATVMALSPGAVLVGRNIQIDAVLALVMTLATLAWVRSADAEEGGWGAVGAGALSGLAIVTKLQGAVIVPAFALADMWRTRSFRVLRSRRAVLALAGAVAVGLPWHLANLSRGGEYASSQSKLAGMVRAPDAAFFRVLLLRESIGLFSLPLFVLVIAGLCWCLWRRKAADVLIVVLVAGNLAFYALYHHHTYYLYCVVPFAALAAGALADTARIRRFTFALAVPIVLALVLTPYALTSLSGKKLGYWSSADVVRTLNARGVDTAHTTLAVDQGMRGSWDPALKLYSDGLRIVTNPLAPGETIPPGDRVATLDTQARPASADASLVARLDDVHVSPVLFGWAVDQDHEAVFYFLVLKPVFSRVGPWYEFGLLRQAQPSQLWVHLLSPEYADKVRASQIATPSP